MIKNLEEDEESSDEGSSLLIIGETLFDCIEGGDDVLGGAPCNVAWNLVSLGSDPKFITAVGKDELGERAKSLMSQHGLTPYGVQEVEDKPTGMVKVVTAKGIPSYEIVDDQAYDYIKTPVFAEGCKDGILYHGSLAFRRPGSMATLKELREMWQGPVFVDVNTREPWFNLSTFGEFLREIDYLKLNTDELDLLVDGSENKDLESKLSELSNTYEVKEIILTAGGSGAYWYCEGELFHAAANDSIEIADTIGAGDAFASVCLIGIQNGWGRLETLEKAGRYAEGICGLYGATTDDKGFYEERKKELFGDGK